MQSDLAEYNRLLYVAMTRAEDRLYICGARGRSEPAPDCWYNLVADGLSRVGEAHTFDFTGLSPAGWQGDGYFSVSDQALHSDSSKTPPESASEPEKPAAWMLRTAPSEPTPPEPLTPTRPSMEEPPARSPLSTGAGNRFRRGLLVHRLLELLPSVDPGRRYDVCHDLLQRPVHGLTPEAGDALAVEVMNVLEHPDFQQIFGPDSRAEVALAGNVSVAGGTETVSGQVDRLVVTDSEILVIDYKTMRPVPASSEATPAAYLRQMAIYRLLLRSIWPERLFRGALLWTEGPILMPIDDGLLDRHTPAS